MQARFEVKLLSEALKFLQSLDSKTADKIFENIREARMTNNPLLFKKLRGSELWEFRTRYGGNQYRLIAFWDKRDSKHTLVVATHDIVKKSDKVPAKEMQKAERIRLRYLQL